MALLQNNEGVFVSCLIQKKSGKTPLETISLYINLAFRNHTYPFVLEDFMLRNNKKSQYVIIFEERNNK
jgi:hypothetical protein